jgi:sulfatase maturation enzyme AslB (radical SAM superfamily)
LQRILPEVSKLGIKAEVVTSGIVRIPPEWSQYEGVAVVVSIDGLQPEHDQRRAPATYERILKNIEGCCIIVHCTVTSQMVKEPDSIEQFLSFWSARKEVKGIRVSLYTPQLGEVSKEILNPNQRLFVISELNRLGKVYEKLRHSEDMIKAYLNPPKSPGHCIFARVTDCISSDLCTPVLPCQLGGNPDCSQCGCVAAVGLNAVGFYRLPGRIPLKWIFLISDWIGRRVRKITLNENPNYPT